MQVYVDDMDTAVINMPLSLKYALKLTEGTALVGFTAATGSMWQNHDILDWRFQVPASPRRRCPPFACAHGMRHAPRALLSAVAENARKLGPHDTRRARHATSTTGNKALLLRCPLSCLSRDLSLSVGDKEAAAPSAIEWHEWHQERVA